MDSTFPQFLDSTSLAAAPPPEPTAAPEPTDYHNFKTVACRLNHVPVLDDEKQATGATLEEIVVYDLDDDVRADLLKYADPSCYRCDGFGIRDWRRKGMVARVCPCCNRNDE